LKTAACRWLVDANGWASGAVANGIVRHMPFVHCGRALGLGEIMDQLLFDPALDDTQLAHLARALKEHTNMVQGHEVTFGDSPVWQEAITWCWTRLKTLAAHSGAGTATIITLIRPPGSGERQNAHFLQDIARMIDHDYASYCLALVDTLPVEQLASAVTLLRA
jgi:hypothetical protein